MNTVESLALVAVIISAIYQLSTIGVPAKKGQAIAKRQLLCLAAMNRLYPQLTHAGYSAQISDLRTLRVNAGLADAT